jgi:hypothetical protein
MPAEVARGDFFAIVYKCRNSQSIAPQGFRGLDVLAWPGWVSWHSSWFCLPEECHTDKDGFSGWKNFLDSKPYLAPWGNTVQPYAFVERLCLMFGLILRDLWQIGRIQVAPELIDLYEIPYHLVQSVHQANYGLEVDTKFIGPIVQELTLALASSQKRWNYFLPTIVRLLIEIPIFTVAMKNTQIQLLWLKQGQVKISGTIIYVHL